MTGCNSSFWLLCDTESQWLLEILQDTVFQHQLHSLGKKQILLENPQVSFIEVHLWWNIHINITSNIALKGHLPPQVIAENAKSSMDVESHC